MTLYLCVDEAMGMAFNGRRQSRDSAVTADVIQSCGGLAPRSHPRSQCLFGDGERAEDAYFMEFACDAHLLAKARRIVVYHWNRTYPADVYFTLPEGFSLKERRDFAGSSHEKITREEYIREM